MIGAASAPDSFAADAGGLPGSGPSRRLCRGRGLSAARSHGYFVPESLPPAAHRLRYQQNQPAHRVLLKLLVPRTDFRAWPSPTP
jgi:hypothetical protein